MGTRLFYLILCLIFSKNVHSKNIFPVKNISSPTQKSSMAPYMLVYKGNIWTTWIEEGTKKNKSIKIAKYNEVSQKWENSKTIYSNSNVFANWADFSSLQFSKNGSIYVNVLTTSPKPKSYGYNSSIFKSDDEGNSWKKLGFLHRDDNPDAEHGFVSLIPEANGVRAFWLDGGLMASKNKPMEIKTAYIVDEISNELTIDERVCSCCGTVSVKSKDKSLIFYRDRSEEEVRDISYQIFDGKWKKKKLNKDNWIIHGCPVNGPDADVMGDNIVASWYTGGGASFGSKVAFSDNGGKSFGKPIRIDDFQVGSLGRVKVVLLNKNEAVAIWVKRTNNNVANIYARKINSNGKMGHPAIIVSTDYSKKTGFPQIKKLRDKLYLSYTDKKEIKTSIKFVTFNPSSLSGIPQNNLLVKKTEQVLVKGEHLTGLNVEYLDGDRFILNKFSGKSVLISYWASWCKACLEEFSYLNKLIEKNKNLKVIAINVDEKQDYDKAKSIAKKAKLKATILWDKSNNGLDLFGYNGLPYTVILNKRHIIRWKNMGSLLKNKKELSVLLKRFVK